MDASAADTTLPMPTPWCYGTRGYETIPVIIKCEAKYGMLWLTEGDGFRSVATHNVPAALVEERQHEGVIHPGPEIPLGHLAPPVAIQSSSLRGQAAQPPGRRLAQIRVAAFLCVRSFSRCLNSSTGFDRTLASLHPWLFKAVPFGDRLFDAPGDLS